MPSSITPGATAFTLTPARPRSIEAFRVKEFTAPFDAA
jgi:hypothetical protein